MRQETIQTPQYRLYMEGFTCWLTTLNYSESAVKNYPKASIELLIYLERQGVTDIKQALPFHIEQFAEQLKKRKNKIRGAGISSHHINGILQGVKLFLKYLSITGKHTLQPELIREPNNSDERLILTKEEIKALYKACDTSMPIGLRDRAMLAIFYGCGLRKNEGLSLDVGDVLISKSLLYVRKGKNYKERYVPVTKPNLEDITNYLYDGRDWFLYNHYQTYYYQKPRKKANTANNAFFLNQKGVRINDFTHRLRNLQALSDNGCLLDKQFGLHTLRHSIATHLLQNSMDIEYIAQFLGHKSLESTQIYTHLANEM